jgi:cell division inhibitor SepF
MAGAFKRMMEALGLDDNDGYADGDYDYEAPQSGQRRRLDARDSGRDVGRERADRQERDPRDTRPSYSDEGGTIVHPRSDPRSAGPAVGGPTGDGGVVGVTAQRAVGTTTGTVRTVPASPRQTSFHVAAPTSFSDVKDVGERFRSQQPVIINLTEASREEAHRILDFASGLIFGLNGDIKKVADRVFMLTPTGYEVSADQKRELQQKGLHP